ncbi:glucose-1-phosphate thymidylyltransferase RfbA [Rossellomorea sp. YZS02]|uniref:glucose-1-phosphate thymidylyltransferase RfbA n=1 Tax=Rossellomorea sp. YZS02 TaxID=3097358 RepID=UPI002A0B8C1F|nr:glucose-1-phosphate thymidylyltransferase RfbA [Rossellomorea sp. YZS02]MDX8345776.1 glucose-1-phosphate thymidylyltransferase RfbA [Rossellomorea sp. YZS02]
MKGIILAGGSGTRLYPLTKSVSKHLLPIYDKPMIYYPLSSLMNAGIREVLVISTKEDVSRYKNLLGNGSHLGIRIEYRVQSAPEGIAQAFLIGEDFIEGDRVALILGDNLFYGYTFEKKMMKAKKQESGATIFGCYVNDPERFGVVTFSKEGKVLSIEEKPVNPSSHYAVPGLYFYDYRVVDIAKTLTPSNRGELEITDINQAYLSEGELSVQLLGSTDVWIDAGTPQSLFRASQFVKTIEETQQTKLGCIEEIAYRKGYISEAQLIPLADSLAKSDYGKYLKELVKKRRFEVEHEDT